MSPLDLRHDRVQRPMWRSQTSRPGPTCDMGRLASHLEVGDVVVREQFVEHLRDEFLHSWQRQIQHVPSTGGVSCASGPE